MVSDPERESPSGNTWTALRQRMLDRGLVAAHPAVRVRRFSGETLSAIFDGASGHTHVLNEAAAGILATLEDGCCHSVKSLVMQSKAGNLDLALQTIISLTDQRLAVLVPLDGAPRP